MLDTAVPLRPPGGTAPRLLNSAVKQTGGTTHHVDYCAKCIERKNCRKEAWSLLGRATAAVCLRTFASCHGLDSLVQKLPGRDSHQPAGELAGSKHAVALQLCEGTHHPQQTRQPSRRHCSLKSPAFRAATVTCCCPQHLEACPSCSKGDTAQLQGLLSTCSVRHWYLLDICRRMSEGASPSTPHRATSSKRNHNCQPLGCGPI